MKEPSPFPHWTDYAHDIFDERVAIMRDGNNVPTDAPTPAEIVKTATGQVELEIYGF